MICDPLVEEPMDLDAAAAVLMTVPEVVDGEVVEDVGTALTLREGLDLSDAEQVRELEQRIEQMGVDGDTSGLVAAEEELSLVVDALRNLDRFSEQLKTAGILRIKTWAQLGGMDDLDANLDDQPNATRMRGIAAVQERKRLPDLISWAQANDRWGLAALYHHTVPWGCAFVRTGALKAAIEGSGLSIKEIARRSGATEHAINTLRGHQPPSKEREQKRVQLGVAKKVGLAVGYNGSYPTGRPGTSFKGRSARRTRERRLYGKNLPATGGWSTIHDSCLKIRSAINALDAADQNVDGLWLMCDDLFRAAQEGLKGLRGS